MSTLLQLVQPQQIQADVAAVTATLPTDATIQADAAAALAASLDSIATALLDLADGVEAGVTVRQALRAQAAVLAGLISDAGTGSEKVKGIGQASDGTTRVVFTDDASGNRSVITLTLD